MAIWGLHVRDLMAYGAQFLATHFFLAISCKSMSTCGKTQVVIRVCYMWSMHVKAVRRSKLGDEISLAYIT